jgi:hypothetical protein
MALSTALSLAKPFVDLYFLLTSIPLLCPTRRAAIHCSNTAFSLKQ